MSDLLVAAPMRVEAALISSAARGSLVRKTGMGPHRARTAAEDLGVQAAPRDACARLLRRPG